MNPLHSLNLEDQGADCSLASTPQTCSAWLDLPGVQDSHWCGCGGHWGPQSGLYPIDLFSLVGPARSARLPLMWLWGSLRTTVWPLPHRPVQPGWTCQEYKTPTDVAVGVTEACKLSLHFMVCAAANGLLTLQRQARGKVTTGVSIFGSLVWHDLDIDLRLKQELNPDLPLSRQTPNHWASEVVDLGSVSVLCLTVETDTWGGKNSLTCWTSSLRAVWSSVAVVQLSYSRKWYFRWQEQSDWLDEQLEGSLVFCSPHSRLFYDFSLPIHVDGYTSIPDAVLYVWTDFHHCLTFLPWIHLRVWF